jgi:uncharacterized SAM-binding protein YcdF (DUF218 family)
MLTLSESRCLLKIAPIILVTSAAHMPRAMRIFQMVGMKPIPAPADFRAKAKLYLGDYLPGGEFLLIMESAIHEYLGLAYLGLFPSRAGK